VGFGVWGVGFRVWGLTFIMLELGLWVTGYGL